MMMPLVIGQTWDLLRENPQITREQYGEEVESRVRKTVEEMAQVVSEREREKFKAQRDRKRDPKTIKRNVEICDLRKKDRKHWSLGRLAKKYGVSVRTITLTLQEEATWRRLAGELGRK
jgi:hypothetical protein